MARSNCTAWSNVHEEIADRLDPQNGHERRDTTLAASSVATIHRHGQSMSMNNTGEEVIELVSPTAGVVDEIRYNGAAEGQVVAHPAL